LGIGERVDLVRPLVNLSNNPVDSPLHRPGRARLVLSGRSGDRMTSAACALLEHDIELFGHLGDERCDILEEPVLVR
jgi:hypothetical protein